MKCNRMLRAAACLWLTAVVSASVNTAAAARYCAVGAATVTARIAAWDPKWVKGGRMEDNGVLFAVCPSVGQSHAAAGWQMIGIHNSGEVAMDVDIWVTVSDGGEDVQPLPGGSKWTHYWLASHTAMTHSDWTSVFTAAEITHIKANMDYTILAPGTNRSGNNDNKSLWTLRIKPGQYAILQMIFNGSAAQNGIQHAALPVNGNAIGGKCGLWYQAIQLD